MAWSLSLCAGLTAVEAVPGETARLHDAIQAVKPAEDRAVMVGKAQINLGPATLVIDEGVLLPASAIDGRTLEVAFVGSGWFRFTTTDPVEYGQIELFTGDRSLLTPVTHAVLAVGSDEVLSKLLAGERASGAAVRDAAKLFKGWVEGAERRGFAMDIAMLRARIGDPVYGGYFAAWCRSPELGDFYYVLDPSAAEPVTLGQFVPLDMSGWDVWQQRGFKSFLRAFKIFGRFADFSAEHPGRWDTWVSLGPGTNGNALAEPEHYSLNVYVNPTIELDARCSATIRLRAGPVGVRTIGFHLSAGVKVSGVFGPGAEPLEYIRRESALHVFLPGQLSPGESYEVRVDYEGDLVETIVRNESYALIDTSYWYPQTGDVNRATYDVTLRRPKKFGILASGRIVDSGTDRDVAWERRTLDLPAIGFTFEVGSFDVVRDQAGHVELTFGFQGGSSGPTVEERQEVVATVKKALPFFEATLGPYPLDYLTVVTVDRGFSQGYLSMVTLSNSILNDPDEEVAPRWRERAKEQRALTIAHEVSHQWWGNWVGWASYRDQWLSEAIASYSALLYGLSEAESRAAFLARNALDWRNALTASTSEGRPVGSLGPVTLGIRLNSSKSYRAYQAIVYEKGAVVLRMLCRGFGDEKFAQMLGELAKAVANRTIDTSTFIKALERMSGQSLQSFAAQYIYGTGLPDVYYTYAFEPKDDGKSWIIRGSARQIPGTVETLKVDQDDAGRWRIDRKVTIGTDVPSSSLIVPFQVIVTPPEEVAKGKRGTIQRDRGFGGRVVLQGRETPFQFTVPEKPERFELDQLGEVLAIFHDADWAPKRTLRLQAKDLEATGDFESAERILREALGAPLLSEHAAAWVKSNSTKGKRKGEEGEETIEKFENARIRTLLARFLLDRGDLEGAEAEILAAEGLLEKPDAQAAWWERHILRSRLDLARGDAQAAYLRLRNGRHAWWLGAEGQALLAVAASASGHDRMAEELLKKAEARGVDMKALRKARESGSGGPG